jgi:stalled ribosome alternative rescue factor ArfA
MKNTIAKDLRSPKYRVRTVRPKKGKGSYNRKGKGSR